MSVRLHLQGADFYPICIDSGYELVAVSMDSPPAVALAVEGSQAPVLFRAAKRRKITRTHSPTAGDEDDHTVESTSQALVILDESAGAEGSIAEANAVGIQLRRPMRRRLGGIIVSTEPSRSTSPFTAARDENNTQEGEQLQSLSRFVKPTGQIATSDKHMCVQPLSPHSPPCP